MALQERQDKIKVREALVDAILQLIIQEGQYTLDNHRRFVDKNGQVVFGNNPNTDSNSPLILYKENYQVNNQSTLFNEIINKATDCFYDPHIDEYITPSSFDSLLVWHYNIDNPIISEDPGVPYISFDFAMLTEYENSCTVEWLYITDETLNQLSSFVSFENIKPLIDINDAKEILDTNIFELLPKTNIRQDQINKFFRDYANLKPPFPPLFDTDGNIINETEDEYDSQNNMGSNPIGSVSKNKQEGYITRLEDNSDNDNVDKSLEWLRDDLSLYLKDIDANKVTDIEDSRPEYTPKSKGYLKIRNLNQSIIIRNEEKTDIGLIGPNDDEPVWQRDGFTISMWVKFKDKVNGGTVFNFGNPFRQENPKGFSSFLIIID